MSTSEKRMSNLYYLYLSVSSHFAFFVLNVRLSNGDSGIKKKHHLGVGRHCMEGKCGTLKVEPLWKLSLNTTYSRQLCGGFLNLASH